MNYLMKLKMRMLLIIIAGLTISYNFAKADELIAPEKIMVKFTNPEMIESFYEFYFRYDQDEFEKVTGFKFYRADGLTDDLSKFSLYKDMAVNDENLMQKDNWVFALIQNFDSLMNYSFYITAYNQLEESDMSEIVYAKAHNQQNLYINIKNIFPETVNLNEEVSWTPELETNMDEDNIKFSLLLKNSQNYPEGMEIDEITGEITWTPQKSGYYFFGIRVSSEDEDHIYERVYNYRTYVSECETKATVTINIYDENNNPADSAYVILFDVSDMEGNGYGKNPDHEAYVMDGVVEFDNVDKGEYLLGVYKFGYYEYWYEDVADYTDATLIEIDCADELTFNVNLVKEVHYNLELLNDFATTLKVGEEYTFTPEVNTDFPNPEYVFSLFNANSYHYPEGLEIDEETGEITWTPEEAGTFQIGYMVQVTNATKLFLQTVFNVNVSMCDDLASVTVNVYDSEDNPVDSAYAYLLSVEDFNDKYIEKYYEAYVINGLAEFTEVDKGTYYLAIVGYNYNEYWYEGASSYWDATPIEINCGDEITLEANIEEFEMPEYYTISGTVRDAETGDAIPYAQVHLYGNNGNSKKMMSTMMTDQKGYYEFYQLPDNMNYIVKAGMGMYYDEKGDTAYYVSYIPQYYDHVSDINEATEIELTENVTGVDFDLTKVPEYENSISGYVYGEGEEEELIQNGFVIAFLVQSDDDYRDQMYYGVTSIIQGGEFSIQKLIPGEYILVAMDAEYNYFPGYYLEDEVATMKWQDATRITVDENSVIEAIKITLPDKEGMWGGGIVRGRIGKGKHGGIVAGEESSNDPLNGAMIFLADQNGNVLKAGESNETGEFSLENISNGTYTLIADKVGYSSFETEITIDDENQIVDTPIELEEDILNSIGDDLLINNIYVYPNPTVDNITLTFEAEENNSTIKITDVLGNTVYTRDISTAAGLNSLNIELNDISSGSYYINVKTGNKQTTIPFIVK